MMWDALFISLIFMIFGGFDSIRKLDLVALAMHKTKKQVVTSLFTTYPAIQNKYYLEEVHSEVNMDSLFEM